jgi:inner membrane transporter RhtA
MHFPYGWRPPRLVGMSVEAVRRPALLPGVATMLATGVSNQVGAAVGAHAFPAIGPAGVTAVRQFVAAAVLLPVARPDFRRFTRAQWWPTIALGLVFATMNLSLYTAVDRIGLGLAVTLEFLGPLAVAIGQSRSRRDLLFAATACSGVWVLVLPGPTSDYLGLGLAVLAAGCWASYILLNRLLGSRLPGLQGPAAATSVSALLYVPVAVILAAQGRFAGAALVYAISAGVFASAVPYAADLIVLRRVPAQFFGVFMSVNPVLAALAGMVILAERPALHEWAGILIVVVTNALMVSGGARSGRRPAAAAPAQPGSSPDRRSAPRGR